MIDKTKLQDFIESRLQDTDCFLTDLKVSADNNITVEIDADSYVDIDFCVDLSRAIEEEFPRDDEDYELEVGSAGLTSPLKLPRQYRKHLGEEMEIYAADSKKYSGILTEADDEGCTLRVEKKVRLEGEKKPTLVQEDMRFPYADVRKAVCVIKF